MVKVRASLGLRRISSSTSRSAAAATRDMNSQFKQILQNLDKVLQGVDKVLPEGLKAGLEPIFEASQVLVPKLTGKLKGSGFLETGTFRGNPVVVIGYGKGNDPDYTIFVHEDLDAEHEGKTQAKFLQQPLQEQFDEILPRVQRFMRSSLGT